MTRTMHEDVKGIFATAGSVAAAITAWLPAIEAIIRIGAGVFAIAAGYYAASYWRARKRNLNNENKEQP